VERSLPKRKPPRPHRVNPKDTRYSDRIRATGYPRGSGVAPYINKPSVSLERSLGGLYPWDPNNKDAVPMRTPMGFKHFPKIEKSAIDRHTVFKTEFHQETVERKVSSTSGETITLKVPEERSPEHERASYEKIFNYMKDNDNWKTPTHYANVPSRAEANMIARALVFYTGGATILAMDDGSYTAYSKGYYHYIGA